MRTASTKDDKPWQWLAIFGTMALAIVICELVSLAAKWQDAIVYTVMVFAIVIVTLRIAWGRKVFWHSLVGVFVLHMIGVIVVVQAFPFGRFGIPKLLFLPTGMVEVLLIIAVLWRRTVGRVRR
jgi:hypothetical protein